jgi:hypothetical protein
MIPSATSYNIKPGDSFYANDFPKVVGDLAHIKNSLAREHAVLKSDMVISFYRDHCLSTEWVNNYPALTDLIVSRTLIGFQLESLFQACRHNLRFTTGLETYIRNDVFQKNMDPSVTYKN